MNENEPMSVRGMRLTDKQKETLRKKLTEHILNTCPFDFTKDCPLSKKYDKCDECIEYAKTLEVVARGEYVRKESVLECLENMSNETVKVSRWNEAHRKDKYNQVALMDAKERIDALNNRHICIFCGGNNINTTHFHGSTHTVCADCKRENFF